MRHFLRKLWLADDGQDIAEYAVMLAVILVLVVGTIPLVGSNANNAFFQRCEFTPMTTPIVLPGTKRGRGNPTWVKPLPALLVILTVFEMQVERLGLSRAQYGASPQLKSWCDRNRNRVYVPEWLLAE